MKLCPRNQFGNSFICKHNAYQWPRVLIWQNRNGWQSNTQMLTSVPACKHRSLYICKSVRRICLVQMQIQPKHKCGDEIAHLTPKISWHVIWSVVAATKLSSTVSPLCWQTFVYLIYICIEKGGTRFVHILYIRCVTSSYCQQNAKSATLYMT